VSADYLLEGYLVNGTYVNVFYDDLSLEFVREETAWAGTEPGQLPFAGKNWATYFAYHVSVLETYGYGIARWTDADGCPWPSWELYVPDGTTDMAGVVFNADIAIKDIATLEFDKKVTSYNPNGWNPSVILLIDADGDGLEFDAYDAMEWHFTHVGTLLGDDAFIELESPTGLTAVDGTCSTIDAFTLSGWGADASGFVYGDGGYGAGLAGFQSDSSSPYGVIHPSDMVKKVIIVIGGAGSWMDETVYVDNFDIGGP
jgi:hypothetical protein